MSAAQDLLALSVIGLTFRSTKLTGYGIGIPDDLRGQHGISDGDEPAKGSSPEKKHDGHGDHWFEQYVRHVMQIAHREERFFSDAVVGIKHVEHQTSHEDENGHHDVRPAAGQRESVVFCVGHD